MKLQKILFGTMLLLLVSACGNVNDAVDTPPVPSPKNPVIHAKAADYALRVAPTEQIDQYVEMLKAEKLEYLESQYRCLELVEWEEEGGPIEDVAMLSDTSSSESASSSPSGAFTFTDTNNQEQHVHEGDVVKLRGDYAYVLRDNEVEVYRIWPTASFAKVATLPVEGYGSALFANNEYLVVLSVDDGQASTVSKAAAMMGMAGGGYYEQTHLVSVYDLRNPSAPRYRYQKQFQGALRASRRVGDRLALVLEQRIRLRTPAPYFNRYAEDCESTRAAAYEARREQIAESTTEDWLPINSAHADLLQNTVESSTLLTVAEMAIGDLSAEDQYTTVRAAAGVVYASQQSIYVGQSDWYGKRAAIHAFSWGSDAVIYRGTGVVDGTLKDSFSLSEYKGVLRVVAGVNYESHSVYTLDATDPHLPMLGGVDNIGQNERLYAVRFIGPRGYAVTFKKVDPLYVIDLADPSNVQVLGELKIPGYSSYLHPLGRTHLIGVGKDTEEANDPDRDFAWFQGVKLSIFDVSDPSDPRESHKEVVGDRGTSSPVLYDHRAFTYDPARQLMALPISLYEGEASTWESWNDLVYDGLQLYSVDPQTGFTLEYEFTDHAVQRAIIYGDDAETHLLLLSQDDLVQVSL